MDGKTRQKKRVRQDFLDAARELVLEEGTQNLTARKIGERAGYSYATIYNYFDSLDHLLFEVTLVWLQELAGRVRERLQGPLDTREDLGDLLWTYVRFYLEHPNIFGFFFYDRRGVPDGDLARQLEEVDFGRLLQEGLSPYMIRGQIPGEDGKTIGELITYHLHGMLLMTLADGAAADNREMREQIDRLVGFLLAKETENKVMDDWEREE